MLLIILRHGEKPDGPKSSLELSPQGKARAQMLAETYLGSKATNPSVLIGQAPSVFFAITPHTIETASPSAESWGLPVTAFCTVKENTAKDGALDKRTQEAALAIQEALKSGSPVIVVWEHHRIADAEREQQKQPTLRELLNLGVTDVPKTWPDGDFDTIWIFTRDSVEQPWQFRAQPQNFQPTPAAPGQAGPGQP